MKKRDWIRALSRIAFVIYMIVLVYFLLLSDGFGRTVQRDEYQFNLIPFVEIMRFVTYREYLGFYNVMINLVGNVVAFIPFGALIRWVINRSVRWYHVMGYTFLFSLSVELLQLIAKVGAFDVDDLILNTFGGLLGFFVYCILRWFDRILDICKDKRRNKDA
ncbi:MAG: VanZ family protein [Lachnospiraceae bacterium]|nr:VanZ family protein [Lachnospiraceae bacterium]